MRNFFIFLFVIVLLSGLAYAFSDASSYSTDYTQYLTYCQFNQSDSTVIQKCESGASFGEYLTDTGWEVANGTLYHTANNVGDRIFCNLTSYGQATTQSFTIEIEQSVGNSNSFAWMWEADAKGTSNPTTDWVFSFDATTAGLMQEQITSTSTGYTIILNDNLSTLIAVNETGNGYNISIRKVTNNSGVISYTQVGSTGWRPFNNAETTAKGCRMLHNFGATFPADKYDEIVAWNWTSEANAYVRPAASTPPLDTTLPKGNITLNNTSPKRFDFINISINATDETSISSINYTINYTGNISKFNYTFSGTSASFTNKTQINVTKGSFLNLTVYITDTSNNVYQNSTFLTVANTPSSITAISYTTSGGTPILNLQNILKVNATLSDADGNSDITSSVVNFIRPDATTKTTLKLTNDNPFFWNDTSVQVDQTGQWTIQIATTEVGEVVYDNSTKFTVNVLGSTATISTYFGYDTNDIPSDSYINNLSSYYNIIGVTIPMSSFDINWSNIKNAISRANTNNIKTFITFIFDNKTYSKQYWTNSCTNFNNNLTDLRLSPYADALSFILLETNLTGQNNTALLNQTSSCIFSATQNKFVIYSKNYQNTTLDANYISFWNTPNFNATTPTEYINLERGYFKNTTSLTRIYNGISSTIIPITKNYNSNILTKLRGNPKGNNNLSINSSMAEVDNGDFIVFNNQTTEQIINISYNQQTGKDFWDSTYKSWIVKNNNQTNLSITVNSTSANIIYSDNFNTITIINNSDTLFKSPTVSYTNQTYAVNGASGSFTIAGANDARIELWNPDYGFNNLEFHTYAILPFDLITNYSQYNQIVIARTDTTNSPSDVNTSLQIVSNGNILDRVYGYISVADYNNTKSDGTNETNCNTVNPWETAKKSQADIWTSNYTANVFIDGFDIGFSNTPDCFESRIKRLGDHIRIDNGKKTIFNSYTIYATVANYGDSVMRESCFSRWNGTDVNNPVYDWEDFGLMKTNADFMRTHGKPVICMAFGNVTDYSRMYNDFLGFAVMYGTGNNNTFNYGQPNFQSQREVRTPNLGTMLESVYTNNSPTDWTRKYNSGIVHYNPTTHSGYVDDGATINSLKICTKAQIYSAGVTDSTPMSIVIGSSSDSIPYQELGSVQFASNYSCKYFNSEYQTNGHYFIRFQSQTRANPTGLNLFNKATNNTGVHSWYDNTATNPPVLESDWTAYGRSGTLTDFTTNQWDVYIVVNKTTKQSIDIFSGITQNLNNNSIRFNTTITSGKSFNISIQSDIVNTTLTSYTHLYYLENGIKYNLTSINNNSDCITTNPTFMSTTINSEIHGVCSWTDNGLYSFRFLSPHLSTKDYRIANLAFPSINITSGMYTNQNSTNLSYTSSGDEIISVTSFANGKFNASNSSLYDLSEGNYTVTLQINNTENQKINSTINLAVDKTIPITSNPLNRTVVGNSTNILTNTDVNLTFFIGDIYLSSINLSENATGVWVNHSLTISGNQTYHFVISQTNLTGGSVVGWKYDVYDFAGNHLDPIYTFGVGSNVGTISLGFNLSNITSGNVLNVSGNISEPNGNIAFGWVVENSTGINTNYTFTLNGSNANFSQNITISSSKGTLINFSVFYNNTFGTQMQNSTLFISGNAVPPVVSLIFPSNNSVYIVSISDAILFKFTVGENVPVCNLYYNNIKIANSTNSLGTTTISASATGLGLSPWFVNCTDVYSNIGQSPFFSIDTELSPSGGGATSSSPSGGGGGGNDISLPPPIDADTGKYIYSLSYICSKTKTFIQNHFVNGVYKGYTYDDLNTFQYSVLNDTGQAISKITLSDYIDYSESYCNVSKSSIKQSNTTVKLSNNNSIVSNFSSLKINFDINFLNFTLSSYIPIFSKGINIGSLKYYEDKNANGILTFLRIFFKIKPSDPYSENPNYMVTGLMLIPLSIITIGTFFTFKFKKFKKRVKEWYINKEDINAKQ